MATQHQNTLTLVSHKTGKAVILTIIALKYTWGATTYQWPRQRLHSFKYSYPAWSHFKLSISPLSKRLNEALINPLDTTLYCRCFTHHLWLLLLFLIRIMIIMWMCVEELNGWNWHGWIYSICIHCLVFKCYLPLSPAPRSVSIALCQRSEQTYPQVSSPIVSGYSFAGFPQFLFFH